MNDPNHPPLIWYAGELIVAAIIMCAAVAWAHWVEEKKRKRLSKWKRDGERKRD